MIVALRKIFKLFALIGGTIFLPLLLPFVVTAHEIYVLSGTAAQTALDENRLNIFSALQRPTNLWMTAVIGIVVLIFIVIVFLWQNSKLGQKIDRFLKRYSDFAFLIVRITLAIALFYGAINGNIFGPELAIDRLFLGQFIAPFLAAAGLLIFLGLFTEVAAFGALMVFILEFLTHRWYVLTYLSYFGAMVALILFGSRFLSVDLLLFGKRKKFKTSELGILALRVCYGLALMFSALYVKLLHPALTLAVIEQYHLTQYGWLFPPDPLLITLGAFIVEFMLGFFIAIGFETRLMAIITLFFFTLSGLFFQEAVWPHFILYGISLCLFLDNGGAWTVDGWLQKKFFMKKSNN